jgi:hypothetical protein
MFGDPLPVGEEYYLRLSYLRIDSMQIEEGLTRLQACRET